MRGQKKPLLWEKIYRGIIIASRNSQSEKLSNSTRELEQQKVLFLSEVLMTIEVIGNLTEKSSVKYQAWVNRGKGHKERSERLGVSTDRLRSMIWYFNKRIESIVGENLVVNVVDCNTSSEFKEIQDQFWNRVKKVRKDFFR